MREEQPEARDYYLRHAAQENWSVRQLQRQIEIRTFQRLLSSQSLADVPGAVPPQLSIRDFIKDPYVLEFIGLPENPTATETEVESAIISQLQGFLLEMGHGFSFVARQMRVSTETSHFYLDLVFYHYVLKCFVIIDLKTTKLTHQDIGQIDMYVRLFDDLKRGPDDTKQYQRGLSPHDWASCTGRVTGADWVYGGDLYGVYRSLQRGDNISNFTQTIRIRCWRGDTRGDRPLRATAGEHTRVWWSATRRPDRSATTCLSKHAPGGTHVLPEIRTHLV